jgi:hypothetical protein
LSARPAVGLGRSRSGARRPAWVTLAALALGVALACQRGAPTSGPGAPGQPAAPLPAARAPAPFTHPMLSGASAEAPRADCSRRALLATIEQVHDRAVRSTPGRDRRASTKRQNDESCPTPAAQEAGVIVRGELLDRVGSCVGQDGPLDAQWAMIHSAVSSLGVCLDCPRTAGEQAAQCHRALDVLRRAREQTPAP